MKLKKNLLKPKKFTFLLKIPNTDPNNLNKEIDDTLKALNEEQKYMNHSKTGFILQAISEKLERGF